MLNLSAVLFHSRALRLHSRGVLPRLSAVQYYLVVPVQAPCQLCCNVCVMRSLTALTEAGHRIGEVRAEEVACDIYAGLTAADWTNVGSTDAIGRCRTERDDLNQ